MEFRQLGYSGLEVPVLGFGTGTFGGQGEFFSAWGNSDVTEATRLVDICLDAGVNLFDTADVYSRGASEEILGKAHSYLLRESGGDVARLPALISEVHGGEKNRSSLCLVR